LFQLLSRVATDRKQVFPSDLGSQTGLRLVAVVLALVFTFWFRFQDCKTIIQTDWKFNFKSAVTCWLSRRNCHKTSEEQMQIIDVAYKRRFAPDRGRKLSQQLAK